MTREELIERIEKIDEEIFLEEMVDLGYNFAKVRELKSKKAELEKELAKMD